MRASQKLIEEIKQLKEDQNAVILAHAYQREEVNDREQEFHSIVEGK